MEKTVKKIDLWSIFMYLIIYSIAGFFIETIFAIITKGVIESRKSFIYGPFCAIYGIGAVAMIIFLKNEKKVWKLFIFGAIIGATVEYLMSFFCEKIFGVKWWDYSNCFLNIQGRTCIGYAFAWGLLAIFLIRFINPYMDKIINNLKNKKNIFKVATSVFIMLFLFDALITNYALDCFYCRVAIENNLNIENKEDITEKYTKIKNDKRLAGFINQYFSNEKMLKLYPNLMIQEKENKLVYIDTLVPDAKSFYFRLGGIF